MVTNLLLGDFVVTLLDEVFYVMNKVSKPWASHLKQSSGSSGVCISEKGGIGLLQVEGLERALAVGVNSHYEVGIELNLL